MNKKVLDTGVQIFIENNYTTDTMSVLLKEPHFDGVSPKTLVEQLEAKKKCQNKLPTWFNSRNIYYPNKLNIEQTSSEKTAAYKASLISGKLLLDATGGFGVDSYYFSKKVESVVHCEIDSQLSEIAAHNFSILGADSINCISKNGLEYLTNTNSNFDWVYLDPSRRNQKKGKVIQLDDYEPNILEHLEAILEYTENVMLKTSPMLDISKGLDQLKQVNEVHVVAVQNEVKELLWLINRKKPENITLTAVNILAEGISKFAFSPDAEKQLTVPFLSPQQFLYEPNAAILKSGAFKSVANNYNVKKLAQHSHLYTSDSLKPFPGRVFQILKYFPFQKKSLKKLGIEKANITVRNFPTSVAELRKQLKIKDGGDVYLFFTKDELDNKLAILCKKIKA